MRRTLVLLAVLILSMSRADATVTTPIARNDYTGNGVTTVFPYSFRILEAGHIQVTVNGVIKSLTTDYTVSGVGSSTGGNVTFLVAPPNGQSVILSRNVPITQTSDYVENAPLSAETLERNLDKLTMIAQQLRELIADPDFVPSPFTGGIPLTIIDAKGDLIAGTASDTVGRLAVGANTSILTADSTQATGLRWVTPQQVLVTDAGALCDGTTDDVVAIQALINAVPDGSEIQLPAAKRCRITSALSVTKGLTIHGITRPSIANIEANEAVGSTLVLDSTTADAISINTVKTVMIRNLGIRGSTVATTGALIKVTGGVYGGLNGAEGTVIENCTLYGGHEQLHLVSAMFPRVERNIFWNTAANAILIQNTGDNDQGDPTITNNTFSMGAGAAGINFQSGGGVKLASNKFLAGAVGILIDRTGSTATADILITGNSIENFTSSGILFLRNSGVLDLSEITITGNQIFSPSADARAIISTLITSNPWVNVAITGNVMRLTGGGTTRCIDLNFMTNVMISGNVCRDAVNFVNIASANVVGTIGTNHYTQASNLGIIGTMTNIRLSLPGPMTIATIGTPLDGSMVFCTDCTRPADGAALAACVGAGGGSMAVKIPGAAIKCM